MVRRYGLVEHKKVKFIARAKKDIRVSYLLPVSPKHQEMAHFFGGYQKSPESTGSKKQKMADGLAETSLTDIEMLGGDSFPFVTANTVSSGVSDAVEVQSRGELELTVPDVEFNDTASTCSSVDVVNLHGINAQEEGPHQRRSLIFSENARDMICSLGGGLLIGRWIILTSNLLQICCQRCSAV